MRRSPPALSCILGYDLRRKRPLVDLTPEDEEPAPLAPEEAEAEAAQRRVMTLVVEETPTCEQITRKNHNPDANPQR